MRISRLQRRDVIFFLWTLVGCATVFLSPTLAAASSPALTTPKAAPDLGFDHKASAELGPEQQQNIVNSYARLPLAFIANQGQEGRQFKFFAHPGGNFLGFSPQEIVLVKRGKNRGNEGQSKGTLGAQKRPGPHPKNVVAATGVRLIPVGMNPGVELLALNPLQSKINYYIGNDPAKWRTDVPTYSAVLYREAYSGIDLKFYGNGQQMEYDVIVKPGGDPSQVKFHLKGAEKLQVNSDGDLVIRLPGGEELLQQKPVIYQEVDGRRIPREGKFHLSRNCYGFELAAYDRSRPLVIDPVLVYSTYLGGAKSDVGNGIGIDNTGCAYVIGTTYSSDFPTQNPLYPSLNGTSDVFVTKFDLSGASVVYSTYVGGRSGDNGNGIAVDALRSEVWVTGSTSSNDFPMDPNGHGYQKVYAGGGDAFLFKLNIIGQLRGSSYLGGSGNDVGYAIAIRPGATQVYVAGETSSTDFPILANPVFQRELAGKKDAFVAYLDSSADALYYSTYLGGSEDDSALGLAVDQNGQAYVAGKTRSIDFPLENELPFLGGDELGDAFVTKLNADATALGYSTYLAGNRLDEGRAIAVDDTGRIYVTGLTSSTNFPIFNAYQPIKGGGMEVEPDAFVSLIKADGSDFVFSTYLGGSGADMANAIAVNSKGQIFVTGETYSTTFPLCSPLQSSKAGISSAFVTKFSVDGSALDFSTYLGGGGSSYSRGNGIAVSSNGNIFIAGATSAADFPTRNPYQATYQELFDAFVLKIGNADISAVNFLLIQ